MFDQLLWKLILMLVPYLTGTGSIVAMVLDL